LSLACKRHYRQPLPINSPNPAIGYHQSSGELSKARWVFIKRILESDYFRLIHFIVILNGYIWNCSIEQIPAGGEKPALLTNSKKWEA
jgi:hypothetical protein